MKSIPIVSRSLLGIIFFGFGLNGFVQVVPPPLARGAAAVFICGLMASRYFFPLLFMTYLFTGAALLVGRFVPLALAVLAPIIVNIAVMHLFVPSSGTQILLATLVTVLETYLAWYYRAAFRPLLSASYDFEHERDCDDRKQALRAAQLP